MRVYAPVIAAANALGSAIQQVPDDAKQYSDPKFLLELPFPFPGTSAPTDRFDLHPQAQRPLSTFTYMGRGRFAALLQELPVPLVDRTAHWAAQRTTFEAAAAKSAAADPARTGAASASPASACAAQPFFPPIRSDIFGRSFTTFVYGTIGWGQIHCTQ